MLPSGFAAYTLVLHPLIGADGAATRWLAGYDGDPWTRINDIQRYGFRGDRFAADIPLYATGQTAAALAAALGVGSCRSEFVAKTFVALLADWVLTVTPAAMADYLTRIQDYRLSGIGRLNMFYPVDGTWVANAPYDMGCTYVGSTEYVASLLLSHPGLEAIPVGHP